MDELARSDPPARRGAGRRIRRAPGRLARGPSAALALIAGLALALAPPRTAAACVGASVPAQASAGELRGRLAELYARGRYAEVAALWDAEGGTVDARDRLWPYAALIAAEALLRAGDARAAHGVLDELERVRPDATVNLRCHALAMRGRLHVAEGRLDLAAEPIERARELVDEVRALGAWAAPTVRYAWLRAVELALARSRNEEVEELVADALVDEQLWAAAPLEHAVLLLDRAAAQEDRETDAPAVPQRAAESLARALELLRPLAASAERDRLLARTELALARLAVAAGETTAAAERLARVRALLGGAESTREVALLATLEGRLALAAGRDRAELERARAALRAAFETQVARLARLPERSGGLGLLHFREARAPLVELARLDAALDGPELAGQRAVERLARLQALGTLARSVVAAPPSLAEVRAELLEEGAGLVVLLTVARRSVVVALDRAGVVLAETAGLNALQRARGAHLARLQRPLSAEPAAREVALAEERALAEALAADLWPPGIAARVREWDRVSFVGLDALGPIALGWLPLGPAPHLGRAKAWDVLPSIPFGVERARQLAPAATRLAPAAASAPHDIAPAAELLTVSGVTPAAALRAEDPALVPLPLTDAVARALERPYASASRLTGTAATPARALAEAARHRVVQFLVHALHEPERVPPTGLVLAPAGEDPGVLWADAVAARELGPTPRLVVIAACRSGRAPLRRGDAGSADLGGAWLAAGVPAALVSHSDLTWGAAVELLEAFGEHLRSDWCAPAEALRRALADRTVADERELPFRYGLLEVVGLGGRTVFAPTDASERTAREPRTVSVVLLVGVLLCAALIGVAIAARRGRRG